jgi:hypothetical protein
MDLDVKPKEVPSDAQSPAPAREAERRGSGPTIDPAVAGRESAARGLVDKPQPLPGVHDSASPKNDAVSREGASETTPPFTPVELARVRIATEDFAGWYFNGPLRPSPEFTARYVSEGHLVDLVDRYGLEVVMEPLRLASINTLPCSNATRRSAMRRGPHGAKRQPPSIATR